jgi:acetyltransferase-like isoleucine patch superfamily enzyme
MLRRLLRLGDPLLLRLHRRMERLAEEERQRGMRLAAQIDDSAVLHPEAALDNHRRLREAIRVGAHTHLRGQLLTFWNAGRIEIGEWTYIGHQTRIWSQESVRIGDHVLISHLVDIHDTDSHPGDWEARRKEGEAVLSGVGYQTTTTESAPVVIEDDVWIGFKATILKGVRLGRGSIIAAGSVVTRDVAPWSVAAGNPAKVIREIARAS